MGPRSRAPEAHPQARFDDLIYDFRTMAERVNARLKDEFAADFSASAAHSRSNAISCSASSRSLSIRSSVSSTTGPPLPDPARCTRPAQENSPRSGYYARSSRAGGYLGFHGVRLQVAEPPVGRDPSGTGHKSCVCSRTMQQWTARANGDRRSCPRCAVGARGPNQ